MSRPDVEVSFDYAFDLAKWFIAKGRFAQAVGLLTQLRATEPYLIPVQIALSTALQKLGRLGEAAVGLHRSIAIQPDIAKVHFNLANLMRVNGELEGAIDRYRRSAALSPEDSELRAGLALALLEAGSWSEGFAEYEWRASRRKFLAGLDKTRLQLWRPGTAAGKSVLLVSEQGAGDVVQFIRYARLIHDMGSPVHVLCPANLTRLVATAPGVTSASSVSPAQFDMIEQVMSLPHLFGITPDNIFQPGPYLRAPPPSRLLPENGRIKVGLVWAGNPRHVRDHLRSCAFQKLLPLIDVHGVDFYSLQVGPRGRDLGVHADRVTNLAPELRDFSETAAMLAQLDLLISVDTVVAHIAGAIGRPVWLMLSAHSDWRWLGNRKATPWYPTMRLFRQERLDDWHGVVAQLRDELQKF